MTVFNFVYDRGIEFRVRCLPGSFQARSAHASDEVDSGIYNATVHGDLA